MSKIYFGIDLGTSSSSISYIVESPRSAQSLFIEPTTIKFSPPPGASFFHNWQRLPSMVYVEQKGNTQKILTGFQAEDAAQGKLAKPFENLFMSVKSDMGTLKVYEDSVHPEILSPIEVSAEIIKELIRVAEKETGISPKKANVVITVPASFTHNQRQDTLKAARLAGLTIDDVDLLDEPIAAFIHTACHQKLDAQLDMKRPKNILMFDLGAGTCDISLFEASYDPEFTTSGIGLAIKNKAISNYEKLGGDNIDLHIVQKEVLQVFCDKNEIQFSSLPEKVKRELRFRLKLKAKQIKEEICRQISHGWGRKSIKQHWTIDAFPISALGIKTKKTIDTTKLESFMELMFPFITDDLKSSFRIGDDYVAFSFFGPVVNALKKARLDPEDIHGFIFNGGSCHNPVIRKAFETYDGFSIAKFFDTPDLDLSVSKGAAIHCYYLHQNKKSLVIPIVNSDIGIYTLGLKRENLVEAGTSLPFPEDGTFLTKDDFCVPKDNMSNVGISVYSGDGRIISNLKLPLPIRTKKGEPISLGLRIDSNKVMTVTAFMKNTPGIMINAELSNPWSHRINTPEDMAANELWERVAQMKKEKQPISTGTMIDLANRERLRNNLDSALEILQRLENKGTDTDDLNNILALCYVKRSQPEKALKHFRKASDLNPNSATYAANYGSQLFEAGKIDEALLKLREAVNLSPEDFSPYYWLGFVYRKQGNEELSKKEFSRARQILRSLCSQHPQNERFLDFLEDVDLALGDYEEADKSKMQLQAVRNSKMLDGSPDSLIAGPKSGIWKEEEIFENEE